jgi:manganese efflux pump family protein
MDLHNLYWRGEKLSMNFFGDLITIVIMAFALSMDAFSVGLGMGMVSLRLKQIFKIGIYIGIFHMIMPLIGMFLGKQISEHFGNIAGMIGGCLLLILGIQMIISSLSSKDKPFVTPIGIGLLLFAISVSLDSFSIGLSLGIFGARVAATIILFGMISTALTWLGLLMARRFKQLFGSYGEALGGSILLGFALKLLL